MMSVKHLSDRMRKIMDSIQDVDYHDLASKIDDQSIDLLLTDIPYNIKYEGHYWDMGDFNIDDWLAVVSPKIKDTGTAVVFCGNNQVNWLMEAFVKNGWSNSKKHHPELFVWYKSNARDHNPDKRAARVFEAYVVATKSDECTFNLPISTQLAGKTYEPGLLSYASNENVITCPN